VRSSLRSALVVGSRILEVSGIDIQEDFRYCGPVGEIAKTRDLGLDGTGVDPIDQSSGYSSFRAHGGSVVISADTFCFAGCRAAAR